jgi:hypothetical protein
VPGQKFFFMIRLEDAGSTISCVNTKLQEFLPSPNSYSGRTRQVLQIIESLHEKLEDQILWDEDEKQIHLEDHDYLIPLLSDMGNLIDQSGKSLRVSSSSAEVILRLKEKKVNVTSEVLVKIDGELRSDFHSLTRQHLLCDQEILSCNNLGNRFQALDSFNTTILKNQLEAFLTIFCTNYQNVSVHFPPYQFLQGEKMSTVPSLIIHDIDASKNLQLTLQSVIPEYPQDFFLEYDVQIIATVDEVASKILLHDLESTDLDGPRAKLLQYLKEAAGKAGANPGFHLHGELFIIEKETARILVSEYFGQISQIFSILGGEKLSAFNIRTITPKANLSLSSGIDFLEGRLNLDIEGSIYTLSQLLAQLKKSSYIPLSDGSQGIINRDYMAKLERVFKPKADGVKVSFYDLPLVEDILEGKISGEAFPKVREIFRGFNTLEASPAELPNLKATLRHYQQYGYSWLRYLNQNKLGGCLADDMGLGKTVQTIALLSQIYPGETKPSLLVVPTSLLHNWRNEIQRFAPTLDYNVYYGGDRSLKISLKSSLMITSYGTLRRDIEDLCAQKYHAVILDESQNIKNTSSQISKAVTLLKADFRLAISGTPVENNILELYSLFRFLNPGMFGSEQDFRKKYADPIHGEHNKQAMKELKKKIYPFILRRTKADVLKDLPEKVEQIIYSDMDPELARYYEDRRLFYHNVIRNNIQDQGLAKSRMLILQAMSELRQIASIPERPSDGQFVSPKLEILMDSLQEAISNGHKALVFVNFLDAISLIGERLERASIPYLTISGSTKNRSEICETFQNDPEVSLLLMTLKTGGVGLNLTAAEYVFIYEPWWNYAAEQQAVDRAHRIGQKNTVFSYKLITSGTIEEKIIELQERKKEFAQALLDGESSSEKHLSEEDIDYLFG